MIKRFYLTLFTFILLGLNLLAQNGNVRGFVYTKDNGEPALFTNVYFKGTTYGASTDINGFFSITKLPAGKYTLVVSYIGYDTLFEEISVNASDIINKKFYLNKGSVQLEEITLTAEQESKKEDTRISVQQIDPVVISKLPSVGEPDLAQYLQVLPGVVFTGDQGGQLYIRGGSPVQNKVLLDGMIIYNPFHSIGLFSVFDNDIMRNADVYTGGFGAEYGGRISSVMDITTRDGNKKRISGKIGASTFGAKALVEGPIVKLKEDGKGSASFLLSVKNSYLPFTSKNIYSYVDTAGLPFSFNDYYGKVSLNAANGSKLNVFGFNFNDKVDYKDISTFKWTSFGGGSNFVIIPNNSNTLIEGNFAYSQYKISAKGASDSAKHSFVNGFNGGFKFTNFIGRSEVKYGFEMIGVKTDFEFRNNFNRLIEQEENTTEVAAYAKGKIVMLKRRLVFEPSFRLHYYASLGELSPEPRLALKLNITNWLRFKGATGIYTQNLIAANSDRDVVNLFYGFLTGPDNLQENFSPKPGVTKETRSKLQKANHLIAGFEIDLPKGFEINIEGYQKNFTQLTNLNREKLFDDDAAHGSFPDSVKKDYVIETGYARGLDFLLKWEYKRFYFWAVYSLGFNKRWDGNKYYPPVFDRRHNINLVASIYLDKKKRFELDLRWNFGSGFPFTPTQGFYPKLNFDSNNLNYDYTTANSEIGYIPGTLFSKRLPSYHRLDISVKYKIKFTDRIGFEASIGVTNAYNRKNIFYFDRIKQVRKDQLPVLPNANISLSF